jgi:beta-glucosidase
LTTQRFPDEFLWGTATSAHQVEGNNINSDGWLLEHLPNSAFSEPSGDACDHYHRYKQDIALMAKLGFNAYRFSIEWARIEPEEGEFSLAELEHYRRVLGACHENGLKPVVTLHHFTSPRWLIREGGWIDEKTPARFARYAETVSKHLGDLITAACTFNEPNIAPLLSTLLPFKFREQPFWETAAAAFGVSPDRLGIFQFTDSTQMREVMFKAHKMGFEALHDGPNAFPVGLTLALIDILPVEGGQETADKMRYQLGGQYLEKLQHDDFVGVQTYSRMLVGPDGRMPPPEDALKNQMGDEFFPESIGGTIRYAARTAKIPIMVTENGLASLDDILRQRFYERAIQSVGECLQDGIDVRGYFCWSAFDNFEWNSGYGPKFGIIAVDRLTQKRTPKPSAFMVGQIAQENQISF